MSKLRIATMLFIALIVSTAITYAVTHELVTIPMTGNMQSPEITATPSTVDWGDLVEGAVIQKSVNLKNTGPLFIYKLHLTYSLPPAFEGSLSWNLEGQSLAIDETKEARFTLNITKAPDGPFSFNVTITEGEFT